MQEPIPIGQALPKMPLGTKPWFRAAATCSQDCCQHAAEDLSMHKHHCTRAKATLDVGAKCLQSETSSYTPPWLLAEVLTISRIRRSPSTKERQDKHTETGALSHAPPRLEVCL
jgi:hypothetical protein